MHLGYDGQGIHCIPRPGSIQAIQAIQAIKAKSGQPWRRVLRRPNPNSRIGGNPVAGYGCNFSFIEHTSIIRLAEQLRWPVLGVRNLIGEFVIIKSADRAEAFWPRGVAPPIKTDVASDGPIRILAMLASAWTR